jgi:cell division protein FtsI (penicillin-binding protein 3)
MIMVALLVIAGLKLVTIQTVQAPELRSEGAEQRVETLVESAERGSILDSTGVPLAFSVRANALTATPYLLARDQGANAANRRTQIALGISRLTGIDPNQLYAMLNTDKHYVVLAPLVEPAVARAVTQQFPEIGQEQKESRQYPGGELAANIIGAASWDMQKKKLHGVVGL